MNRLALTLAAVALVTSAAAAVADDSGHRSINSLKEEQSEQKATTGTTTLNGTASDAMVGAKCANGTSAMAGCKPTEQAH